MIKKSWRKSISLRFDRHWVLQVHAPKLMLRSQIQSFITSHYDWIEREYTKILDRQQNKKYYLFWKPLPNPPLKGEGTNYVEQYYKKEAKKYIVPRCRELALKYGFNYKSVRITSALSRWGSCSSQKTLNFSYRLIMSPKACIDYVIIHELCHLRQMNHSSKFWKEVSDIMPEYKQYEKHLRERWIDYRL